jgi:hypothetical protein
VIAFGDCIGPSGILAQARPVVAYTVSGGPSFYRLPELGHGTGFTGSGSFHWRRRRPLQPQIGLTIWSKVVDVQAGPFTSVETKHGLVPEIGMRLAGAGSVVRPYVAAGGGFLISFGGLRSGWVLDASTGIDWHLQGRWSIRTDARLRSVRPFAGRTLDASLGLGWGW